MPRSGACSCSCSCSRSRVVLEDWKPPTSEAYPRNAVSGKAHRRPAPPSQPVLRAANCQLPTANCQLPSAKPICRSCRDKQGFDQAQAKHKHKHKHKQANAIAAVQTVQHIAVAAVHCFPTPPKRSCRVPYHVCIRTYAVSLFASRSKFTRCRGSVPPYGTACFGVPPEMN
jgi:hypothetical protein